MSSPAANPTMSTTGQYELEAESDGGVSIHSYSSEVSRSYIDDGQHGGWARDQPNIPGPLHLPNEPNPFAPSPHPSDIPNPFSPPLHPPDASNPFAPDYTPALSNLIADLSVVEAGVTTEYITRWQETVNTVQTSFETSTIQTAYRSCMGPFYESLPQWNALTECDDEVKLALYRNFLLLRDWGMSYSVLEGQLDQLPEEDDLVETIVSFLLEISGILQRSKSQSTGV
jgi:hypothetical protein